MKPLQVVLDTNVVVSALRSRRGTSFQVLRSVGSGRFDIAVSVPLVLEYEAAVRTVPGLVVSEQDQAAVLDYLVRVAHRQEVFFLWRPALRDPKDDMVLELAVAAGCQAIVTYNRRDFAGSERYGVHVWSPADLLRAVRLLT